MSVLVPGLHPRLLDAPESRLRVVPRQVIARVGAKTAMLGRRRRRRRGGSIKDVFDGMTMKGNQHGSSDKAGADVKESRRDRLKLALRENLKRRKSQARGRGDAASSESADASPDSAGGKS